VRLFGRISIYGEYLTGVVPGLIAISDLYLGTAEHANMSECQGYDPKRDKVAALLRARGFATQSKLAGNLPLGYGLAGSTVLAFLHLHDQVPVEAAVQIATECDEIIHGFPPSGVDAMACLRQRGGFYHKRQWADTDLPRFEYTLALFPKLTFRPLAEIQATIGSNGRLLWPLADQLTNRVVSAGELDYEVLLEYCRVLLNLRVYSPVACEVVRACLNQRIVAKGIGGLHEKALLVISPQRGQQETDVMRVLSSFRPMLVFPGKGGR
jgi:hypothetical protein